ncbi:MAG: FAD-dependent thymidylate synthase [Bdellovibrionales bacterium]
MPDIFVVDDQHPEDIAMLQALYSRSPASVVKHLEKLKASGSGKFMDQFYVGYGHASIGDCATTTLFVEQVSMLVAKAIQDNPLYNGQEASTRYLDFSKQTVVDPYNTPETKNIQTRWMEIYNRVLPLLTEGLKTRYPFDPAEYKSEKTWQNTCAARAFDIARSLLPVGTTTLLSWTTSLRAARDHLRRLKFHPLPEVRETAQKIFSQLYDKYPHSFNPGDMAVTDSPIDIYAAAIASRNSFVSADDLSYQFSPTPDEIKSVMEGDIVSRSNTVDLDALRKVEAKTLSMRPPYAPLPWRLEAYGRYNFLFLLDFGSFRDLQRHRNGVCQIPLIDGRFGLNPWYMEQFADLLSNADSQQLEQDIAAQFSAIADLPKQIAAVTTMLSQYLFPMGTRVLVHASYSIPEVVYVGELRSNKTVHPTLRPIAQRMLKILNRDVHSIALHGDMEEDDWCTKRGEQTISGKESAA